MFESAFPQYFLLWAQIAVDVGATVIATVSSEEKARVVREHGAQHVIVTAQQNVVDEVLKITNGEGVAGIFDGVGKGQPPPWRSTTARPAR